MAIVVEVTLSGITKQQYDDLRAKVGWLDEAPTGGLAHLTWFDGDTCHNVDAWESDAAFAAFAENRLGPGVAAVGIASEPVPVFHPAHEVFLPKALTIT
jgi:hypothetical protein